MSTTGNEKSLIPTGILGFDVVLNGGFRRANVILVEGGPGTGKSTLASEFAFRGAMERNEPAVIVNFESGNDHVREDAQNFGWDFSTVEANRRLVIMKLSPEDFFGEMQVGEGELLKVIKDIGAKRVVIDGLTPLRLLLNEQTSAYRAFLGRLVNTLKKLDVTTMLTTEAASSRVLGETGSEHEHYLSDTIITLRQEPRRRSIHRSLEIAKARGQKYVSGRHSFKISNARGCEVFVRAYARERELNTLPVSAERVPFGIVGLNEMLGGGVYQGSATLLVGSSGTGKSIAGMQFLLAGVQNGERGLHVTLDMHPQGVVRNIDVLGLGVQKAIRNGDITILQDSPLELELDEHFALIDRAVEQTGAKRIVIDSLAAYETVLPLESHEFLFALSRFLRCKGITAVLCYECPEILGVSKLGHDLKASSVADAIVLMNHVEISTKLRRALTVSKALGPAVEQNTVEYVIKDGGITLLDDSTVTGIERVPQLPLSSYYGVLARSPTRHSPIIDEHVASGKPMPKSRIPKPKASVKISKRPTANN